MEGDLSSRVCGVGMDDIVLHLLDQTFVLLHLAVQAAICLLQLRHHRTVHLALSFLLALSLPVALGGNRDERWVFLADSFEQVADEPGGGLALGLLDLVELVVCLLLISESPQLALSCLDHPVLLVHLEIFWCLAVFGRTGGLLADLRPRGTVFRVVRGGFLLG